MSNKLTTPQIAYLAGLFDGEGCVHITIEHGIASSLTITIAQNDETPLRFAQELLGGVIHLRHEKSKNANYWKLHANEAADFLRLVEPYLLVKKKDAKYGIKFQELRESQKPRHSLTLQEIYDRNEISKKIDKKVRVYK